MICIIDYELGNVISVKNAIEKVGFKAIISRNLDDIATSEGIIIPGVGSFEKGILNLKKFDLINILKNEVFNRKKKILGICLGFQLMCNFSEEFGNHNGRSWIDTKVKKIDSKNFRLPHIGWNKLKITNKSYLLNGINNGEMFYFNHSYCVEKKSSSNFKIIGECDYGNNFIEAIEHQNIFGIQPHPEKSQYQGLKVIENFCKI